MVAICARKFFIGIICMWFVGTPHFANWNFLAVILDGDIYWYSVIGCDYEHYVVLLYFRLLPVHQHCLRVLADMLAFYQMHQCHTSSHRLAASLNHSWRWVDRSHGSFRVLLGRLTVPLLITTFPQVLPPPKLLSLWQHAALPCHPNSPPLAASSIVMIVQLSVIHLRVPRTSVQVGLPIKNRYLVQHRWCHMLHGHANGRTQLLKLQTLQDTFMAWMLFLYTLWNRYSCTLQTLSHYYYHLANTANRLFVKILIAGKEVNKFIITSRVTAEWCDSMLTNVNKNLEQKTKARY